jgi:glycosyltransferase involved in cell wall biosynthesis
MKQPLVSVIVPTKNSAEFLEACLKSIKQQTYKNIELIVVDNFSIDDTPKIAKKYADKFYSKGPERSAQRNYGAAKSKGSYVVIIDSDMQMTKNVIKSCIAKAAITKSEAIIIPEESFGEGFWAQCKKLERSFYIGVEWIEAARFYSKRIYISLGGYNESLVSGEDWDLSQRSGKLTNLERVDDLITHNEGQLKLMSTLKKKYYYAKQFKKYTSVNKNTDAVKHQISPLTRYKLFFSEPTTLFKNPFVGIGMLYMKTCEFAFGAFGYLWVMVKSV